MPGFADRLRARAHELGAGLPRPFWVLWTGMLVNRAGSFVVTYLAIYVVQVLHASIATAGLVVSAYGAGAAVASPLGGYFADHLGRRKTILGALTLGGLGMITLGFLPRIEWMAPACFVVGAVGEAYRPAMQAAVADLVPPADRLRAFGLVYWVINLGFSIGLMVGGLLSSVSFTLLFVGDGLTSLAFALLVWRAVPETRPQLATDAGPRPGLVHGFFAPYRDAPFAAFVGLSALTLVVFMQHVTSLPLDMTAHGLSRAAVGPVIAINGILIVFTQPFLAARLTRLPRSAVLAAGVTLIGLGFGTYAFAHSAPLYALGVVIWTVGEMGVLPLGIAVVADVARPEMRGRYQGAYGISFGVAYFLAPLVGTAVMQRWGAPVLWLGALGVALLVACGHLLLAPALQRLRAERAAESAPAVTAAAS